MKKTLGTIGNVLIWIFVAFSVLMTVMVFSAQRNSKDGVPKLLNRIPVTVLSDSMSPTFKAGDLIIDNALTAEDKKSLKVDDIITFYSDLNSDGENELNTHRIVDITNEGGYIFYTTRGDNAETNTKNDDQLVRYDMAIGKYSGTKVPGLGKAFNFLRTPNGFLIVIVLPLVAFFLFELYRFVVAIVAAKNKNVITKEQEELIKQKAVEEYLRRQNESETEKVEV